VQAFVAVLLRRHPGALFVLRDTERRLVRPIERRTPLGGAVQITERNALERKGV